MQAALGARVPYREAAFILNAFAPGAGSHNHGTIRNETIRVGSRIALEDSVIAAGQQPDPTASGAVAIDGTCVKGHRREGLSRLNVVVGSVGLREERKATFAFVQQHEPVLSKYSNGVVSKNSPHVYSGQSLSNGTCTVGSSSAVIGVV